MVIESIEGANWENFPYFDIEFSPGTNTIIGKSNTGKSSIIRALNWVLENRPRGTSFFPHNVKKPETEIAVNFEEGKNVIRKRNSSDNYYDIDGQHYSALRTDVPQEVRDTTNITDINVQVQKDVHFFLTETPGRRAKKLNEVANLEEMDYAIEIINSTISSIDSEFKFTNAELKKHEEKKRGLEWVKDAIAADEELEEIRKSIQEVTKIYHDIDNVYDSILFLNDMMDKNIFNKKAWKYTNEALNIDDQLWEVEQKITKIEEITESIGKLKSKEKGISLPTPLQIEELGAITAEIRGIEQRQEAISRAADYLAKLEKVLTVKNNNVQAFQDEFDKLLEENGVCPLCGREG